MRNHSTQAFRVFRALLPLCIAVPMLVYGSIGIYRYARVKGEVEVRVERTLQIAHEHALKVLDTAESLLARMHDITQDSDAGLIATREHAQHQQLRAMASSKPQIQGLFVISAEGKLLVNSRMYPTPKVDVADRDSFRWHRAGKGGVYVSQRLTSRTTQEPFFDLTVARRDVRGQFNGVLSVSLSPVYFQRFHIELIAHEPGLAINMFWGRRCHLYANASGCRFTVPPQPGRPSHESNPCGSR
jgi:hypothetical protein